MRIFKLLKQEAGYLLMLFAFFGLLSGAMRAAILPFINFIIGSYSNSEFQPVNLFYVVGYFTLIVTMVICQRSFGRFMTKLTQSLMLRIRISILSTLRKANYYQYEQIGREEIYTSITRDASVVSNSAASIIYASTSAITVLCCLAYLAYLSAIGFLATLLTMAIGISFYMLRQKRIKTIFKDVRESETTFFKHINELLSGFKEVKVNQHKSEELYEGHIKKVSGKTSGLMLKGINYYLDNQLVGQLSFLSLIAFVLFGFPLLGVPVSSILSYVFVILFIMGPIEGVMNSIPGITQANVSLLSIEKIKARAEEIIEEVPNEYVPLNFQRLTFNEVEFSYKNEKEDPFSIGPINFEINRGEMIFIVGGNGSGKTTFFKMLTGLYKPNKGEILVNNETPEIAPYRALFSPIFSDFYLFEKLYGLHDEISEKKVTELIEQMQLTEKVTYAERSFSTVSLSTGQRKRLALIHALLEEKPILVLDEWAADQDPQFRKFFYEILLPELKESGFTIIAITHDDKYFHLADQVVKMDEGVLSEYYAHS